MTDWETQPTPPPEKKGGGVVALLVVGLIALFGAGYVAAYLLAGDKVPRGTTIAGVSVGGKSPAQAEAALRDGLADLVDRPITVTVDSARASVKPSEAGLGIDYQASVAAAGGQRSWSPARLWDYFTGGTDRGAEITVDDATLALRLDALTEQFGTSPRDGAVAFRGTRIVVTDPAVGRAIDTEQAKPALVDAYLADDPVASLALVETQPEITKDEVTRAVDEFANPALSGPVTLRFGSSPVTLRPADYSAALRLIPEDGALVPDVAAKRLTSLLDESVGAPGAPVDATVALVGGKPQVVPAKPGVKYAPDRVVTAFLSAVTQPEGQRKATVEATVAEPKFTTADARKLKIKEKVSSFTTYYPYAEYRNINIPRAAELVNGTVLRPGDTFSLNGTVGERTEANGFTTGFIISNGIFKEDLGGGVSQMATTTFNAAFFAGLKDVEHKTHSFYIDRYPVGREATVAWGAVDLKFTNDTPYGVLIEAHVTKSTPSSQGVVTVSMWSTKYWDITTKTGSRYNLTSPQTRTLTTADCVPNTGYGGFDIDIWRYFRRAGSSDLVKTEKMHTHYIPSDTVICKPPPTTP